MGYTDLWPCIRCGTRPEIIMLGKNFLVNCKTCDSDKVNIYANNIDEVVTEWNRANDPTKRSLFARIRGWFRRD